MKLTLNPEISYITVMSSYDHVSAADADLLEKYAGNLFYIHATTVLQPGMIVRFGAAGGYNAEDTIAEISDKGFSSDFVALIKAAFNAGYDSIHFDCDADHLPGVPYFTDYGARVEPLAYDLPLVKRNDEDVFLLPAGDGQAETVYSMADFMPIAPHTEFAASGFTARTKGAPGRCEAITDNGDRVSLYRLTW